MSETTASTSTETAATAKPQSSTASTRRKSAASARSGGATPGPALDPKRTDAFSTSARVWPD